MSGYSLDLIKDNLLPLLLALDPRPGFCAVLGGTNDIGNFQTHAGVDASQAKLRTIYNTLLAAKIIPIAQGIPTVENNVTLRAGMISFNQHVSDLATELGIPFIDYFPITDDGIDGWKTGYSSNGDNHWGPVGAAAVGQAFRDSVLEPYAHYFLPANLVTAGSDTGGGIIFENGTMVDDANSDGIPDGGKTQIANYWSIVSGGGDCTFSLDEEAGVVSGKWWRINKTANTADTYLLSQLDPPYCPTVTPGYYEVGFMCKVLNPQSAMLIEFNIYTQGGGTLLSLSLFNLASNLAAHKVISLIKVTSASQLSNLRMLLKIRNGTADFYLGQLTLRKVV